MKYKNLDSKKGVAGLNVFLALISMLFVIGIIIMVFAIAGDRLVDAVDDNSTSETVINDTIDSLSDAVDWFPTFIVLGAMVVLILLVVIIITSIRQSGITSGA